MPGRRRLKEERKTGVEDMRIQAVYVFLCGGRANAFSREDFEFNSQPLQAQASGSKAEDF